MAVCAIRLTEKGRSCLAITLLLLNLTMAIMGVVMIGSGCAIAIVFGKQQDMLKGFNYGYHSSLIACSGLFLIAFHAYGVKVSYDFSNKKKRVRTKMFHVIYQVLLFAFLILLFAVSVVIVKGTNDLEKGFEKGFKKLMEMYETNKLKRKEIDSIQINHKCCGSTGYSDWTKVSWYSTKYIRPELSGKGRGVPFTCCNPAYDGPCLHDVGSLVQRPGFKQDAIGKSFYPVGCSETITESLRSFLKSQAVWLYVPMFTEIAIMILTKYLHTSIQNAIENGEETGDGFGYLMKQCPCSCYMCFDCDIRVQKVKRPPLPRKDY